MTTLGSEDVDGKPCFKVEVVGFDSPIARTQWFDKESGLLARMSMPVLTDSPQMLMTFRDYRPVGAVKLPFVMETQVMGQAMRVEIDEIKLNEPMPPEALQLPEDIQALVAKSKGLQEKMDADVEKERPHLKRPVKRR
jgi:hypothetical protein